MNYFSPSIAIFVLLILFLEGFFSGSELALLSADRIQLRKKSKAGDHGAQLALKLLQSPERILASTLLVTSTCVMTISILMTLEFRRLLGEHAEIAAVTTVSTLVIIFGELIPKFISRKHSATLAPIVATPIFFTQKILSPIIFLTTMYTSQIAKIVQPIERLWSGKKQTGKDDLQVLLAADSQDNQIGKAERKLIRKILKFRDKLAKDALLPLVQVDAIEKTQTVAEAFALVHEKKHSRLPVYEERIDNIVGVVEIGGLIRSADAELSVESFMRPAFYVYETQKLDDVLNEMMSNEALLAVVVDEYGGAVGILTREDIFEQIVGDLQDEDDLETRLIRPLSSNKWIAKASIPISTLNEELRLEVPEGDYDTLGGFLLRQFSRIPDQNDELYFDTPAGQLHFVIRDASPRKIESVSIERLDTPS